MSTALANELPPHPHLLQYYDGAGAKRRFLRDIFDDGAADYDRIENILALGSGRWYRRQALMRAGLSEGMAVLDVACGTGLLALEALHIVGSGGRVIGVDPSIGMLRRAQPLDRLRAVLGVGESLPFGDQSFDFLSMGYALRHLPDLRVAFAEFHRVLRPGGRLCLLEISRPDSAIGRKLMAGYFRIALPVFVRLVTSSTPTHRLWRYYWDTIEQCVSPDVVMCALEDAGFAHVRRHRSLGLFSEFVAQKA